MRFNPECVRDILFECEEVIEPDKELYLIEYDLPNRLSNYSWNEILYHLKQCHASGLFMYDSHEDTIGGYTVSDLSPKGHELLEKIRSDKVWKKILKKSIASIPTLISVATEILSLTF